jgi:hypothetical protein
VVRFCDCVLLGDFLFFGIASFHRQVLIEIAVGAVI